ncbi:MAG: YkgJ family cysteine cluster protein [Lachnospiraceae bacterium]|nr:YkgJ family cysteine cluster protein [Lachnospiraceae bacterium]
MVKNMILYNSNDLAKLGCNECSGCSECCRGMGQSIVLDPYDLCQLQKATGLNFSQLMQEKIELHVEDGLILPSLKMQSGTDACGFLNQDGRCHIHDYRPGLCRLFPLGRNYDENGLRYFLLEDACWIQNRTKVKIKKWLGVGVLSQYEKFLIAWHDLRKEIQVQIMERQSDTYTQGVNVKMLEIFYQKPYDIKQDFYVQFEERMGAFQGCGFG